MPRAFFWCVHALLVLFPSRVRVSPLFRLLRAALHCSEFPLTHARRVCRTAFDTPWLTRASILRRVPACSCVARAWVGPPACFCVHRSDAACWPPGSGTSFFVGVRCCQLVSMPTEKTKRTATERFDPPEARSTAGMTPVLIPVRIPFFKSVEYTVAGGQCLY